MDALSAKDELDPNLLAQRNAEL